MNRRAFIATAAAILVAPGAAAAQQTGKVFRIGVLGVGVSELLKGLHDAGYVEGQNLAIEWRDPAGKPERYGDLAAELARLEVDVIVATNPAATLAAKRATTSIPIVMVNTPDPVQLGLAASLGRPGGNITGTSTLSADLSVKQIELLKEAVPRARRIAVLWNPHNPWHPLAIKGAEAAAHRCGGAPTRGAPKSRGDGERVRGDDQGTGRGRPGPVRPDDVLPSCSPGRARGQAPSAHHHGVKGYVDAGALATSYWAHQAELYRRVVSYVDRTLKASGPATCLSSNRAGSSSSSTSDREGAWPDDRAVTAAAGG